MISARMRRAAKLLLVTSASLAATGLTAACGTEKISVPRSQTPLHQGATLFNQRCSGCHTLSYAATHGSAANVRTAEYNNGPNFDTRCERPVTRVLYAIENGGFSGAIMPQNVVVGQQAIDVAKFVATYAGNKEPRVPGVVPCGREQVGTIPSPSGAGAGQATAQAQGATAAQTRGAGKASGKSAAGGKKAGKSKSKGKRKR
jgi:mono/diheme cytochrome c family protein